MRILLPVDESPYSEAALNALLAEFKPRGTQVRVLYVIEPITAYLTAGMVPELVTVSAQIERSREKEAETLINKMAGILRRAGFTPTTTVDTGDPTGVILEHAKKWPADLIVMGSHGLHGLSRLLMGSVSDAVVRHADCSVQVVRVRGPVKKKRL
jgi:nucleotide-binding universal stress UspA family protein